MGANQLLEEILTEAMDKINLPVDEMVANIVHTLTETVPVDFLMKNESLDIVADKLNESLRGSDLDKEKVAEIVERMGSIYREEMMELMNVVLERVFNLRSPSD